MRRAARHTFPTLLQAARNENDRRAREAMIYAAANLSPRDPAVLDLVGELLGADSNLLAPNRNRTAAELLLASGRDALPAVRKALRSTAPATRLAALKLLAHWAAELAQGVEKPTHASLADILPELTARLLDKDEAVRMLALSTLNEIGPAAASTFEALQKALAAATVDSRSHRIAALAVLNVGRAAGQPPRLTPLDARSRDELLAILSGPAREPAAATASDSKSGVRDAPIELPPNEREDAALALRLHGK